jgi:hypothetical protein
MDEAPTLNSGFGTLSVRGRRRWPRPPAMITAIGVIGLLRVTLEALVSVAHQVILLGSMSHAPASPEMPRLLRTIRSAVSLGTSPY